MAIFRKSDNTLAPETSMLLDVEDAYDDWYADWYTTATANAIKFERHERSLAGHWYKAESLLHLAGMRGWELVCAVELDVPKWVFKRPIEQES